MNHAEREMHGYDVEAAKKRLNVTVNGDLVRLAQTYTDNLSQTLEDLLANWVSSMREHRRTDAEHWNKVNMSWGAFYAEHGCFADDFTEDYRPVTDGRDDA